MGWLHATPKNKGETESQPRVKSLGNNSIYLVLPDCGEFKYIVEMWQDVGMYKSGSMSIEAIGWGELAAYKSFCDVNEFEARVIINMSKAFVSSVNGSKDPFCEAPYCKDLELAKQQQRQALKERRLLKLTQAKAAN